MKTVNQGIRKKDAMPLITGKPVYTDDMVPKNCLFVKLLRSPHANAVIVSIDTAAAKNIPGIECILTYQDVPTSRFTSAGQTYPEPSPYDCLILDAHLRYVGDAVAIVAGVDEKTVERAMKLIAIQYKVLEPLLDFRQAKDNPILVHPEDDFITLTNVGADSKRNLCASGSFEHGSFDDEYSSCAVTMEATYHTKSNHQTPMETFRTFTELDVYGKLKVITSTQIPFHVRRILSNALQIPKSKIRVIKPRIGGGFGAKQSVVSEIYPAIVTLKTGKPAKIVYTRHETFTCGCPRHENEIRVCLGSDKEGNIKAISIHTLSNTGAYGSHGPTTVGLSGHKPMPVYNAAKAFQFHYDVVYTNTVGAGAFRGYGAPQGFFALESAVDELAAKLNMDPTVLRQKNMVQEGQVMPAYYGETATSCALDRCLARAKELIGWDRKYPFVKAGEHKVRSVGIAMAMQGSGISSVDVGSATIRLSDDGFYTLMIGAADMGTGADTVLAQIAAERLECSVDDIVVQGVDTDQSPYDSGSYASSTTYVTGMAVVKTCDALKKKMIAEGSNHTLTASESHTSPVSPPPFMVGAAEIELDLLTGKINLIDYVAVVDCGTVINPNLARIQTEGGIAQGIGMALYEDVTYDKKGRMLNDSFLQYKIPTRQDVGSIRVEFESSFEPTGPFGAKSIGEVVINTPAPAIANAVYNATKVRIRTLPITSEKIVMGMLETNKSVYLDSPSQIL